MAASKPPSLTTLQNRAARALLELIARAQTNKPVKLEIELPLVDDRIAVVAGTVTVRGGIGAAPPPPPPPATPPRITTQPRGASTVPGATVTITAAFDGTAPLTVQWLRNDVLLGTPVLASGLTASITTPALTLGDDGAIYKLRVTNSVNSVTSDGALVQVQSAAMPSGVFVTSRVISPAIAILIEGGFVSSRYERGQRTVIWTGTGNKSVRVKGYSFGGGGADVDLTAASYTLLIDGVVHSTVSRTNQAPPAFDDATFTVNQDALTEGWHWLDVQGAAGETAIPVPIYMRKGATAVPQTLMPICTHSHDMLFPTVGKYTEELWTVPAGERTTIHYGMVPSRFRPHIQPLAARAHPSFDTVLPPSEFVCEQLVPCRETDIHRATLIKATALDPGITTTSGVQCYHYSDFISKYPKWALLDGERGHGTVAGAIHLMIGRDGKVYGLDPWRLFRIDTDGKLTTLVGWRHREPPTNWATPDNLQNFELVGDWSAIPPERHGLHEAWGFCWWPRTVLENTAAAPIPEQHNERPHIVNSPLYGGPVGFISDTQNNRVLRVEFNGFDRSVPAKVTEFITGIGDPWDIAIKDDVLYVTERTSHRIGRYSAFTGAPDPRGPLVQGAALAYVDSNRKVRLTGTLAQIQAQPCVAPEGIFIMDNLLYFGSKAMQQIVVINLDTGLQVRRQLGYSDGNSYYYKIAVSDGTFYPKHTIALVTWSNRKYGHPFFYTPDHVTPAGVDSDLGIGSYAGGGQNVHRLWGEGGYSTAVGIGQGRLVCSQVQEGISKVSRRLPTDQPRPALAGAGALEFWRKGYRTLCGVNGWGHYGVALPWGESAAIDQYLTYVGHVRPTT